MSLLARPHPRLSAAATLGIAVGILAPAEILINGEFSIKDNVPKS